jgi:hypothetical protein
MPQINSGKSPPWVAGEIVTAAELNGMIDAATLDPSVITSQTNLASVSGDEYALIVDTTGALKKTQLKDSLMAGLPIETNYIGGYQNALSSATGTLQIQSLEGFSLYNADTSSANSGLLIQSTGGNLTLNATNSGYGHGNGVITLSSGTGGFIFTSSGTGTASFSQRTLFNTVGAIKLPVGTTLQRPAAPVTGDFRFNTTTSSTEIYNGSTWSSDATARVYTIFGTAVGATGAGVENMVYQTPVLTVPSDETWTYEVYVQTTSGHVNGNTRSAYGDIRMTVYNNATLLVTINGSTAPYGGHVATHTFAKSFTSADVLPRLIVKTQTNYGYNEEPKYMIKLTKVKTLSISDAGSCI